MKELGSFRECVFAVVKKIPRGETLSYREVAMRAGNVSAARAVGAILRTNYCPDIPCHRVICNDGKIGGYNRGTVQKQALLRKERAF